MCEDDHAERIKDRANEANRESKTTVNRKVSLLKIKFLDYSRHTEDVSNLQCVHCTQRFCGGTLVGDDFSTILIEGIIDVVLKVFIVINGEFRCEIIHLDQSAIYVISVVFKGVVEQILIRQIFDVMPRQANISLLTNKQVRNQE